MPCLRAAILLCVKKTLMVIAEKIGCYCTISFQMVLKQREEKHFSFKALKAVIYVYFFRFENAISNTLYHSILFYLITFMFKIQESNTHIAANKICCSISDCLYCLITEEKLALCAVEF